MGLASLLIYREVDAFRTPLIQHLSTVTSYFFLSSFHISPIYFAGVLCIALLCAAAEWCIVTTLTLGNYQPTVVHMVHSISPKVCSSSDVPV